ncbi:hypothetical protein N0V82_004636 [Gnomoniopsis sp. IMI 355080]|nr:hypothetical protein N0V82_004636 [Gnomoniopsis sp. IMI 355080]
MTQNNTFKIGQRLSYDGALCTVRYVGQVTGTAGDWLGVEWDDPSRGKHDGSHKGTRYFICLSKSPTAASFVRPTRPAEKPRTFLQAVQEKYAGEVTADQKPVSLGPQVVISGKVAEEIGFDKIRKQQAQLHELKIIIVDGMRIDSASAAGDQEKPIREVCPKVTELTLSRNLFIDFGPVVEICSYLDELRGLRLNGNRFQDVLHDSFLANADTAFNGVKELAVDETLLHWDEMCHIAKGFSSLSLLYASSNQLSRLSPIPSSPLTTSLTSIYLEFNDFTSISDISSLTALTSLHDLHLKGNSISVIESDSVDGPPVFSNTLKYLDISYNKIHKWTFVDSLPDSFPGLTSLRLAHNPIYDNPGFDNASDSAVSAPKATVTEEAYMLTIGRLASLTSLNFSAVTPTDRNNAEMFYLSRIGRQLASVPDTPEAESKIIAQHRRYKELCELYGEPVVNRRKEVNPAFLEARLINVTFRFHTLEQSAEEGETIIEKRTQIPKSFDIYAVKGIAGRLFGHAPLKLRLIWETGEWDPVAGYDDDAGDSSEDEDVVFEQEKPAKDGDAQPTNRAGRWIKREAELNDSPRQFGFCVDGFDVTIRSYLTMYPSPQHFIVRPGPAGRGETIVPLIALDQLPDWIQLTGVPRQLDVEQAVGMINLGLLAGDGISLYEVRLRADRIRAIMRGKAEEEEEERRLGTEDSISKKERISEEPTSGFVKQVDKVGVEGSLNKALEDIQEETVFPEETAPKATEAVPPPLFSKARAQDEEPEVTSAEMVPSCPRKQNKAMKQQHEGNADINIDKPPTEPMLNASRHNTAPKAAGDKPAKRTKPIRPDLTEEMQDTQAGRVVFPCIKDKIFGTNSDRNYCRHWCHYGTCKWGSECRYQHRMPTNEEDLQDVGLKNFPTWYLLMMAGSGFLGMEGNRILGLHHGMNIGLSAARSLNHPSTVNDTNNLISRPERSPYPTTASTLFHASTSPQINSFPRQVSPIDLSLMQGRMSALLAGSTAMTSRQKLLHQIKEMSEMLLRTKDVLELNNPANLLPRMGNREAHHHQGRANLHTNASVAANAAGLSAASRRQALREAERGAVAPTGIPSKVGVGEGRSSGLFDELEGRLSPVGSDREEGDEKRNITVPEGKLVDVD